VAEPIADDIRQLTSLREQWAHAEAAATEPFFETVLSDDAVIMPPGGGVLEGKAACMGFIRDVFADLGMEFDREITLTSTELQLHGDWAFDRGTFAQRLIRKQNGEELRETGKYFWLYQRTAGAWRLARVIGNYDWQEEEPNGVEHVQVRPVLKR
jgi:ketosteroid isomerase-like protein